MNLESLANELLIDLFEFLSSVHLLNAFHDLNSRIDSLLLIHFRTHGLDFRSILKHDFLIICRHLSIVANQIHSLYLSEKDDTPGQIYQFYSYDFTLHHFTSLQSLLIYHLHSDDKMNKILLDLSHLSNITHLTFDECYFAYDEAEALTFMNIIWSLPKLTHSYMKIQFKSHIYFPISTIISSTIEHLSISDIEPQFNEMTHYHILVNFFKYTPNLCQLKVDLPDILPYAFDNFYFQSPILSKSTYYYDNQQWSYDYVHRLTYKTNLSEWLTLSHIQFNKIRELCVHLPIDEYFWSIISKLERLTLLDVLLNDENENYDIQLQILLDRAPRISLLRLRNWSSKISKILPIRKINLSLSPLDLKWYKWYDHEECIVLSQLFLDIQCNVLLFDVTNRECIFELVHTISNLRALNVRCQDDKSDSNTTSIDDELIKWLQ
ncbi:unnamed protein product [Rotaria sordida]|uniref:F-box domain-containing protein n=1 Tax=Rotaria sordida TaxID=392033 RepID=A0A819PX65_9BILA|nr:unnamed protein product [Rotaria sordida]CAF4015812.1 unnamed protein product [Rotaria sordida]